MKQITYFCDRCGKKIDGIVNEIAVIAFPADKQTEKNIETGAELCLDCYRIVDDAILQEIQIGRDLANIEKAKQKKLAETVGPKIEKRKPLDMGKVRALRDAGWTLEKIADEMGVSAPTISSRLNKEKQEGTK